MYIINYVFILVGANRHTNGACKKTGIYINIFKKCHIIFSLQEISVEYNQENKFENVHWFTMEAITFSTCIHFTFAVLVKEQFEENFSIWKCFAMWYQGKRSIKLLVI